MDADTMHLQYARSLTRIPHTQHLEQLRVAACKDLAAHRERLAAAIKAGSAGDQQTPRDAIASAEARLQVINELRQAADAVLLKAPSKAQARIGTCLDTPTTPAPDRLP